MLSRDCDGCSQMKPCMKRYRLVEKDMKVYCPDGTAHLIDGDRINMDWNSLINAILTGLFVGVGAL